MFYPAIAIVQIALQRAGAWLHIPEMFAERYVA
jgi:hypothetical protein